MGTQFVIEGFLPVSLTPEVKKIFRRLKKICPDVSITRDKERDGYWLEGDTEVYYGTRPSYEETLQELGPFLREPTVIDSGDWESTEDLVLGTPEQIRIFASEMVLDQIKNLIPKLIDEHRQELASFLLNREV